MKTTGDGAMDGIKDFGFDVPDPIDIGHPDKGFFGYLLRCKCPEREDVSGDIIFLDDGIGCNVRFPSEKGRRDAIRAEWNSRASRYRGIFKGHIFYVNEESIEDFAGFMTCGPGDAIRMFLERFMGKARASVPAIYKTLGLEPLYAVTHVGQLTDDDRMYFPHIHILWGIKK